MFPQQIAGKAYHVSTNVAVALVPCARLQPCNGLDGLLFNVWGSLTLLFKEWGSLTELSIGAGRALEQLQRQCPHLWTCL